MTFFTRVAMFRFMFRVVIVSMVAVGLIPALAHRPARP